MAFSHTSAEPYASEEGRNEPVESAGPPPAAASESARVPASAAALLGWVAVALDNARVILSLPPRASGLKTRLLHLFFDAGQTLALGVLAWVLVKLVVEWRRVRPLRAYAALGLGSIVVFSQVLDEDLSGFAGRMFGPRSDWVLPLLCAVLALTIPAAALASRLPGRTAFRAPGIGVGLALIAVNGRVLQNDYPGGHFWIAATGATLLSASLAGLVLPPRIARAAAALTPHGAWVALAAAAALAVASIAIAPPGPVKTELLERDTAFLARPLSTLHGSPKRRKVPVPGQLKAAFTSRAKRPNVEPSEPGILPPGGIVMLVTVDALRADVFSPKYADALPNLNEFRRHAVFFSEARSFSTGTRFSLAALLTGRHLSTLKSKLGANRKPSYREDKLPRVQELLAEQGVTSAQASALPLVFSEDVGLVRGFTEHFLFDDGEALRGTPEVMQHAFEQLEKRGPERFFYYMHLLDPHQPYYDHDKPTRTSHDAYMHEVAYADEWIGRLRRKLQELNLADRTMLILASDHGEAFGEHGLHTHNKAFYEVQVRIPILVEYPGVTPRTDATYVSLLDLGPTILDALHVAAPGYFMGDSLVPLLAGEKPKRQRVIYMERDRTRAVLFPDGIKVILTDKPPNEEVYDLRKDPNEEINLRDEDIGEERTALAWKYAEVHTGKRGQPPHRPRRASTR